MANLPWLARLAFFDETTPGTPPANAAAWQSETSIQIVTDSLDPSGIKPTVVEDMRSQIYAFAREFNIEGLRNGEFPFQMYASGVGATTAAGAQVSETAQARIVENGLGGMHRSNSTTLAVGAHTTTSIVVTADTNFAEGAHIMWQHPSTGECHIRRLLQETAANTWSLDEALPITPVNGDVIHGCITLYPDETILANSNSSGRQLSYLMQFGRAAIDELETYVTSGCVNTIGGLSWERNELPTWDISVQYANCVLPHESPPTGMTWAADPVGVAPAVIGPNGRHFFQTRGTSTQTTLCVSALSVAPGTPRTRVETVTESAANMHGTCHYSISKPNPSIEMTLANFAIAEMTAWDANTLMQFRVQAGVSPGFCFAVGAPCVEIAEHPNRAVANDTSARAVKLRPHLGTKVTSGGGGTNPFTTNTALTRASYFFVLG